MDVYVQPVEWDKSLGKKPVTQLLVEVDHQLDGKRAKSFEVLKSESPQNCKSAFHRRHVSHLT